MQTWNFSVRTGSEINIYKRSDLCVGVFSAPTRLSGGAAEDQEEEEEQHQKEASAGGLAGRGASQTLSGQQFARAPPGLAGGPPFRPRVQHGHRGRQGCRRFAAHGTGRLPQPEETLHLLVLTEQQQQLGAHWGQRGARSRGRSGGRCGSGGRSWSSRRQRWVVVVVVMVLLLTESYCNQAEG